MIDITSDLKELNISYDKINVVRQGENSDTFLITTSKKKLIAKKFKNLNFKTITNTFERRFQTMPITEINRIPFEVWATPHCHSKDCYRKNDKF